MARKNFKVTGGLDIDSSTIPTLVIQETITSNSATTVDTIALDSFLSAEYTVTLTQGSKIRTSKVLLQTDGTNVDMTEFGIVETGGTMTGVAVSATTASTNAVLQITVTDAASTLVRYKLVRNLTTIIGYAPDAPTIGTATASESVSEEAVVTFTAPADTGNSAITSYTVISSPGNVTASGSSSPITVTGLTGGTDYTFTVTATNAFGTSAPSSASNSTRTIGLGVLGGTESSDSTYYYRTFTSTDTLTIEYATLNADILLVAGGGGGTYGGGGGAGGVIANTGQSLTPGSYTVTVGGGGAAQPNINAVPAASGTNSNITGGALSLTAAVGGGGGATYRNNFTTYYTGRSGGSGGGGGGGVSSVTAATGGAGTEGQGFRGGNGGNNNVWSYGGAGGGGGGASEQGADIPFNSPNYPGGKGGDGSSAYSSWISAISSSMSSVTGWGDATSTGRIGGGGGGNGTGSGAWGLAGSGGGGSNSSGIDNTGGGGSGSSGNGGSGIVVVRWTKDQGGSA